MDYDSLVHGELDLGENKIFIVELEKLDYVIGFQCDELVFRNYLA